MLTATNIVLEEQDQGIGTVRLYPRPFVFRHSQIAQCGHKLVSRQRVRWVIISRCALGSAARYEEHVHLGSTEILVGDLSNGSELRE